MTLMQCLLSPSGPNPLFQGYVNAVYSLVTLSPSEHGAVAVITNMKQHLVQRHSAAS